MKESGKLVIERGFGDKILIVTKAETFPLI